MLTRRQFNKKLLYGILTASMVPSAIPEILSNNSIDPSWISIDQNLKTLHVNSPYPIKIIDLYQYLKKLFDDPSMKIEDNFPMIRSTDNLFRMKNGFQITDETAQNLCDGSIIDTEHDVIWTGTAVRQDFKGNDV